jgi:hypothetical protein
MVGKDRHNRAIHEAGHAVVARKFGVAVPQVSVRAGSGQVATASAAYDADKSDVAAQIVGYETDTKIALAGLAANRIEHPRLRFFDLFEDDVDEDIVNSRSAIFRIVALGAGESASAQAGFVSLDPATVRRMEVEYGRLIAETAELVRQYWSAIRRVAKHLERHDEVDQLELDRLIDVGMRNSYQN